MKNRFMTLVAVAQVLFVVFALVFIFGGDGLLAGPDESAQLVHRYDCSWWSGSCKVSRWFHYSFGHLI